MSRSGAPPTLVCGEDYPRAGLRVGAGFVMRKRYIQTPAHVGKLRRVDAPYGTGYLHGADEWLRRRAQSVALAAGREYATVKGCVVGRQKVYAGKSRQGISPYLGERGRVSHVSPRQAVDMSETEFSCRRTNQMPFQGHDLTRPYNRDADRARAVATTIGGLNVYGREAVPIQSLSPCHRPAPRDSFSFQMKCIGASMFLCSTRTITTPLLSCT